MHPTVERPTPASRPASARTSSRTGEPGLAELVAGLRDDAALWFQQEKELAKAELAEKLGEASTGAKTLAGAGALLAGTILLFLLGLGFGAAAAFESLGLATTAALACGFLVVALIAGAIGYAFYRRALARLSPDNLKPERTARSLRNASNLVKFNQES